MLPKLIRKRGQRLAVVPMEVKAFFERAPLPLRKRLKRRPVCWKFPQPTLLLKEVLPGGKGKILQRTFFCSAVKGML